ncbi:ATP-binding cassette sub-family a member [Plakobranchus ocellatus]|uniref:ATP-binding cassette sub-family a member n=1 Tax=Plakobranchus ocellatus TaxID=259542 RepID=A0AAV4C8W5_9GAST|nr:ATP-binding cassette sub-family a member [Plakobranchus ocellatus]
MGFCSQLGLLLWKNWILQKRRICVSIFEIILPVFFAVLIVLIRMLVKTKDVTDPTYYSQQSVVKTLYAFEGTTTIGYYPNTSETNIVMQTVQWTLGNRSGAFASNFSIQGFGTEQSALDFVASNPQKIRHVVAFEDISASSTTLPKKINFAIRPYSDSQWRTEFTFPFFQSNEPRNDGNPEYVQKGVIYLQALVGEALAKYWVQKDGGDPNSIMLGAYLQRMAYPPYFDDPMIQVLQGNLPLFFVLSFILSVIINTKNLVYEKERKLKESMKLMGLQASVHWISWFITFAIYLVPALAVYALLFGLNISGDKGPVLANTDSTVFFIFLLSYGIALITFSFMVSTFVQKANVGAALAGILFFGFFFPWYFIQPNYESMGKGTKLAAGLLFNTAMALGSNVIGIYEGTGEGARWDNFYKPGVVDDNLSLLECILLLLFDSLIHCIITWYLDNVWPGEFGVPKPFYFCFTKSYWMGPQVNSDSIYEFENRDEKHFEKDPTGLNAGIRIAQLRKVFGKKVAVDGTSLKMYEGQITVLLGHNGAGKTTTMSMLTGFIPPTSGTAEVNGCDIRDNIQGVRQSLGLCPQHNILFDALTVREHLEFFAKLKGCHGSKMKAEVMSTVKEVGLETKLNAPSQSLSGGQKRKLSVGIALIGGSKVVVLDEPTSGMDPAARRQTWNVLQNARRGRTVLLSTHYMDEADLLGDRIAIMAEGVIKCCGSSLFLKKLYGAGYHLIVVKRSDCNVDSLTRVVQTHIPTAELESVINAEVSYILPDSESARFPALFTELDDHKNQLGINSFGTSATTMEEVFLKVGEGAYEDDEPSNRNTNVSRAEGAEVFVNNSVANGAVNTNFENDEKTQLSGSEVDPGIDQERSLAISHHEQVEMAEMDIMSFNKGFVKNTGLSLNLAIIRALFVKKAIHTWRNRVVTLVQLLLPVIFTILGLAADEGRPDTQTVEPPLILNLEPFGRSYIPYTAGLNSTTVDNDFAELYKKQFGNSEIPEMFEIGKTPYNTFDNYTLKRASDLGTSTFNREMVIGMSVIDPTGSETSAAVAFYNGQPYHAKGIAMNYLMNTFLQATLNDSFGLQSTLAPLPKDPKAAGERNALIALTAGFSIGFFISFGMAFLTTMFIFFLIKERQVGAKHMQVVSGVGPVTYWLPTFMWDFINYIFPSMLLLVVFAAYSKSAYLDDGRFALVILVLALYGWAVLPFMYALQFAFNSPPTGVVMVIVLNIFSGLVTTTAVLILKLPGLGTEDIGDTLDWIFMSLFPNYNMASCFSNIYSNYLSIQACEDVVCTPFKISACCPQTCGPLGICADYEKNYLAWERPGIGSYLLFMSWQGAVYLCIVMLVEYHVFQQLWYLIGGSPEVSDFPQEEAMMSNEDSDVAAEKQRINSCPASVLTSKDRHKESSVPLQAWDELDCTDSLLLVNLYKRYGSFVAVDHICVGVPDQECFGLLGQNGAGKTTTFKMLTGDVMVTGGNAYLKGYDVRNDIKQVQANMGYCPQFDALIDQMTGRETLVMYARLRGVPEKNIDHVVNSLIDILMLKPHADKLTGQYSGGNKRKLSTAIALVGDPPFIMLDEPSSGMDPKARRQLWNVLSQVRASGRTLVLTSHSMEECDALCTRIAIMVNGRFMCLGSPQHLKNKFGQGYTLIIQLGALADGSTAPNQPVIDFIAQNFPGAMVFDDHQGYIHFQVPDSGVTLARVFTLMESTKVNLCVQDYSVHQTTLEQVFLTFTRAQVPPKEDKSKSCMTKTCCWCCIMAGLYK